MTTAIYTGHATKVLSGCRCQAITEILEVLVIADPVKQKLAAPAFTEISVMVKAIVKTVFPDFCIVAHIVKIQDTVGARGYKPVFSR